MNKKRSSLKKVLLTQILVYVAIMIVVITAVSLRMQNSRTRTMTEAVLARENVAYATEVYNWWSNIEQRVDQTAKVIKNSPDLSYDETLDILLKLTEEDPDSQDIYMAYGSTGKFLDGSGWVPDDTFVFTDRAWYTGALSANGAIYTSEPYVDASTGKTCLACAVKVDENVVLSSDINFDAVSEKLSEFQSSSGTAYYFIINKETRDVLVSNIPDTTGTTIEESANPVILGISGVFDAFDTGKNTSEDKIQIAKTGSGKMIYAATDIQDTSWVVVSAVPYSFISSSITSTVIITLAVSVILMLILAVFMYFVINKLINPVTKVTDSITDMSSGDFTFSLVPEGNNEITTLTEKLNEYVTNMRSMLQNLANISSDMNTSAGECIGVSQTLSNSNTSQGESIEKLNSTLGVMNNSIEEIANAATDLATTSNQLTDQAEDVKALCMETMKSSSTGKEEMESMTKNVTTLNDTIKDLTEIIHITARSIEEITGITDTINAISSQTNLLSLNASIEAARAGEMGKGFAVVATEVGTLAQQSSESTETIRQLISSITKNIEDINAKADICLEDMEACMTGVGNANKSFNLIYDELAKATDGIVEIANGISRINEVASNNAATTEEQASTIAEILNLSDTIVEESERLVAETARVSNISEDLNQYSDTIKSDLSKYTL